MPNKLKLAPFTLVPGTATIKAGGEYQVKIIFQPDHPSNYYFDVLLIDIPNQIKAQNIQSNALGCQHVFGSARPFALAED